MLTHDLEVDVLKVLNGQALAFLGVKERLALGLHLLKAVKQLVLGLLVGLVVGSAQESVVFFVAHDLDRVLVVGKEGVVPVGHISQVAAEVEAVFDGSSVAVGAEPVLLESEDHETLKHLVAHQELLRGARDVSVVVLDALTSVASNVHLEGDEVSQVKVYLRFFGGMDTSSEARSALVESLVSYAIHHMSYYIFIINLHF